MQRERSPGANHGCATRACNRARREETTASSVKNLPGISMRILSDPHFEASLRSNRRGWVVLVTWGHALRHEIDGAVFNCEKEALERIAENSPQWLARQNVAERRLPKQQWAEK
jgi:hypothetical protein